MCVCVCVCACVYVYGYLLTPFPVEIFPCKSTLLKIPNFISFCLAFFKIFICQNGRLDTRNEQRNIFPLTSIYTKVHQQLCSLKLLN